jgi:alcohol dehydrogenase class IV
VCDVQYDFLAPRRIVFGWGRRTEAGRWGATLGQRALVVFGSRRLVARGIDVEICAALAAENVETVPLGVISHEPTVDDVDAAVEQVRTSGLRECDFVLAVGGGSAMDLGKAVAALAINDGSSTVKDYLEGVGRGLKLERPPLPVMAMPTTAGTGSEATKNAVISSHEPAFKKSLRSDELVPRVVLIDPELTVSVPSEITAYTGMDAITQLIESYVSCRAKPISQSLARDGLRMALPALATAVRDGQNRAAREAMSQAALLSGMALANSGLGMAHGMAAALGVLANVQHGLACAVMLPATLRANLRAAERLLAELAEAVGITRAEGDGAAAWALIERIEALATEVKIPRRLTELGVGPEQIPALVKGSRGNSMDGNPRPIDDEELTGILEELL